VIRSAAIFCGVFATCAVATVATAESGYFTVAERDGVCWFIDPLGKPFFSLGVSDIGPGPDRPSYHPERPTYAAFQYYPSVEQWADDTTARLKSWNFNTLGSWAHESLRKRSLPYAEVLHLGAQVGTPWNDLFSDEFPSQIDKLAKARVAPRAEDHNLIGWFTDNELSWYPDTLFHFHLTHSGSTATRAKLVETLRTNYHDDFAALERDFEITGATSFNELGANSKLKLRPDGKGRTAIAKFAAVAAERYYQVMHDAIRRYDPNHLILGDRYPWICPEPVAKAAGPYVDVISTNFDWPEASDGYLPCGFLANLHRWTGRPVLVTEYYVAARENRSGNKNTGGIFLTVENQQQRATAAVNRLRLLAEQPYVVGAHWFRFADEPPDGRTSDGEDYNFGLVDIQDRPYESLVHGMTELNRDIPRLHAASRKPRDTASLAIRVPLVRAESGELHSQLFHMQSIGSLGHSLGVYEVTAAWNPETVFLVAMVCHYSERDTHSRQFSDDHTLELTVKLPELNTIAQIRFGGANGVLSNNPRVKCSISASGLRHTLVVALPATLWNDALKANKRFHLQFSLRDLLDGDIADWESDCVLVGEKNLDPAIVRCNPDFYGGQPQAADPAKNERLTP
jgi:hypothetical protein